MIKSKEMVLPKNCDTIEESIGHYMIIKRKSKYGVIDEYGKEIIEPIHNNIYHVDNDVFVADLGIGFQVYQKEKAVSGLYTSKISAIKAAQDYLTE